MEEVPKVRKKSKRKSKTTENTVEEVSISTDIPSIPSFHEFQETQEVPVSSSAEEGLTNELKLSDTRQIPSSSLSSTIQVQVSQSPLIPSQSDETQLHPTLKLHTPNVSWEEVETPTDVDECEEAILATAPTTNFESGDLISIPSSFQTISTTTPQPLLESHFEEIDVFNSEETPSHRTNIKSLYNNYLLENNTTYINQFLDSLQPACDGFELFELLSNYLRAYNNLTGSEKSLSSLKESCDEFEKRVWTLSVKQLSQNTTCDDGNTLTALYKVHTAELNQTTFNQLNRTLKDIKELIKDSFSLFTYSVQLSKTQIEHFLFKSFGNFNLENFQIQSYTTGYPTQDIRGFAGLLRRSITVFFHFIRKPLLHQSFINDCEEWIKKCSGLLLRIATIEDHIFILNHVLRLPPKFVGKFGASLVQVPPIPIPSNPSEYSTTFTHLHLDYSLNLLSTILSSIPKRNQLLSQFKIAIKTAIQPLPLDTTHQWVLVDSDGDDDNGDEEIPFFKERDLIALLQQVPFDKIFRRVLLIYTQEGEDKIDLKLCSEHSVLKLISFGYQLIEIFGNGLTTYYTDRYRQLVKLIGRLILHTIQYVTDKVEIFIESGGSRSSLVFNEYDIFLYEAISVLMTGKNVGTFQFLASVPYHLVSCGMLWEIYGLITRSTPSGPNPEISTEFENELIVMSEENVYYALTTISNMALARHGKENQFVKVVTFHLFQIGFLRVTRDTCSKNVRDLLGNLSHYPSVISNLLQTIKQKMDVLDKLSLYLVKELAFDGWKPSVEDLQLLSNWILNFNTFSLENQLARFIIQSMNWDFGDTESLFLPYEIHSQIGLLVVEAHFKWERPQNMISESVKQISSWVTKNPDFTSWTWEIIKRIHLHGFDWNKSNPIQIQNILSSLPNFDSHSQLEILKKALDEKNPVACAVSLLLTPIGHSLPIICTQGFQILEILIQNSNFETVIHLLFYIIPLFTSSKESILSCEKFRNILSGLLNADMTYVRMAKSLITTEFPGLFTKMFGEMIQTQLHQHKRFSTTTTRLISLWLDLLTKIQGWNKNLNILYLLDVLARFSFEDENLRQFFYQYFYTMYKEIPVQNSTGIVSFLFNWSYSATTILTNNSYYQIPYFVYFILTIESTLETETGFWKSLTKSLTNPKNTLENSIKKACNSSKYSTTSNYLTIYRWAQHALDLSFTHPLLIIFWQKFFIKYFHRSLSGDVGGGIGERFFEGIINTGFQKKLKKRLHETLEFYTNEINNLENENNSNEDESPENKTYLLEHYKKYYTLVNGMALWIEDPRYHQDSLYVPALPPQCLPVELHTLLEGDFADWSEYIDYEEIQKCKKSSTHNYLTLIHRISWNQPRKLQRPPTWTSTPETRRDEFLKRLNAYDTPIQPPPVPTFIQIIPNFTSQMFIDTQAMTTGLRDHFSQLIQFAQGFSLQISKQTALDCTYLEHLPDLYTICESESLVNVECTSGKRMSSCSGPGHVIFKFSEARLNERIGHIIHQNRTDYHNLISEYLTKSPLESIPVAAVFIEEFITNLVLFHRNLLSNCDEQDKVQNIGLELFYLIVKDFGDETNFYPPTRQLFSSFIEVLGHEFVENDPNQCKELVSTCIQNPRLVGTLTPHMNLLQTSTESLIQIYEDVINIPDRDGDLAFVILSKLDLIGWLKKRKPRLIERSQLISLMWKALLNDGGNKEIDKGNPMVRGRHRNHLKTMLLYDFPQHYGEILNLLLEDSEKNIVPLDLWYDFFNALSRDSVKFSLDMDPFLRKRELKRFSIEVETLQFQELKETGILLATHFKKERLAYGIYGLYPKYRNYVQVISCFIQMISYSFISSSLKNSKGIISKQIVEAIWPFLRDIYTPWILPYDQRIVQQDCAQWIQQMNFDSSSLLQPWIAADTNCGALFMNDFTDTVLFLAETLPGSPTLFSHLWNFYAENYAHGTVKDHVISVVNNCFISIPWTLFWPTLGDMELMNKVIEKYLPACHNLMGVIFAQINWSEWVSQINGATSSVKNKCRAMLLNLTVHLATDIVARESPTWIGVMQIVQGLNWEFIQSNSLEPVLNWFVMSIDPRVVLSLDIIHHLDKASFQLLRIASGYSTRTTPSNDQPQSRRSSLKGPMKTDLNRKRYLFVRTYVRLLLSTSTKYKSLMQTHSQSFEKGIQSILDDILFAAQEENQERLDFGMNLKEVIGLISNHDLGIVTRNAVIVWFGLNKDIPIGIIYEIIFISFTSKVPPYITIPLIETAIPLIFRHTGTSWKEIEEFVVVNEHPEQNQYLEIASKDGHFLVLFLLLQKRIHFYTYGGLQSISSLTEILKNIKPKESNEGVLPLIYGFFIQISIGLSIESHNHIGGNLEKAVKKFLNGLALHLVTVGDDKQGWVLLGVLGLTKASLLTVRGRLFARCLSVFLMGQLPVNAPVRLDNKVEDHPSSSSPKKNEVKQHGELESSLGKLEELKQNRSYSELVECIESALVFIRDSSNTLSSYDKLIRLLTVQLFTEPYLLKADFMNY